jgi:hypothetical protein
MNHSLAAIDPFYAACLSLAASPTEAHGASSSKKVYRSSFIPGLHDVCVIFERP